MALSPLIITNPSTTYFHIKNIEKLMAKIHFSSEKKISILANEAFEKMECENKEKSIDEYFTSLKKYCVILDLNKSIKDIKNCDEAFRKFLELKKQDVSGIDALESLENLKKALNSHIIGDLQNTLKSYIDNSDILNVNRFLNAHLDLFSEDFLSEMIENLINLLIKNFNDLNPSDTIYFAEFDEEKFNKEEFRKLLLHDISSIKLSQNLFNKKELKEQIQRDLEEYEKTKKDPEKQKQLKKIIKSDTEAFNKLNYIYSRKLYLFENLFFRLYPLVKDHINIKNKIKIALLTQNVEMASIFLGIYNFNEKKCFLDFDEILIKCIQYKVSISIKFIESYLEILSFF